MVACYPLARYITDLLTEGDIAMHRKVLSLILLTLCLLVAALAVQAQTTAPQTTQTPPATPAQTETREDDTNLETQLYMIMGTNQEVPDSKIPPSLDGVIKQLRATLPFKNYRLAATLVNRVKNEGRLDLVWVGAPLTSAIDPAQPTTRSSFKLRQIKLARNREGQSTVQVAGFSFSASIPLPVSPVAANPPAPPVFNYEGAALSTDISMREGEPVIVGTLNVGPTGDAVILVLSAKRTSK